MATSVPGNRVRDLAVNDFSNLITEVFGQKVGCHTQFANSVAGLPAGFAMEFEGEAAIRRCT